MADTAWGSGVSHDECERPWVAIVRVVTVHEPSIQSRWHYAAEEDALWADRWVTQLVDVEVERTVVGERFLSVRVERCCGTAVLEDGTGVPGRWDQPEFVTGRRFVVAGAIKRSIGDGELPLFWGRAHELPTGMPLPPDGVLFGAWTAVCDANPDGVPAGSRRTVAPLLGYDSPLTYSYPESRPAAEMPSGVIEPQGQALMEVDVPVGMRVPEVVQQMAVYYGVRLNGLELAR
jgi:hypothetical protein